ncbi:hypothetical protein HC928_05810 [bacterium]|nr:hypothetical protein [bacterium]
MDVTLQLANSVLVGNRAADAGGALYAGTRSSVTLVQSTVVQHQASSVGGALVAFDATALTVQNSIVWNNTPNTVRSTNLSTIGFAHSIVGGSGGSAAWNSTFGTDNGGNWDVAPLFRQSPAPGADGVWGTLDDAYGDLQLQEGSPAIDGGDNSLLPTGLTTDRAGQPRIVDGDLNGTAIVDMGAYELSSPVSAYRFTLTPYSSGPLLVNVSQITLTAQLRDPTGAPLAGWEVTFTVTGANPATWTATTAADGVATVSYTGPYSGTDNVTAIARGENREVPANQAVVGWVDPINVMSTSTVWGRFFPRLLRERPDRFKARRGDTPVLEMAFPSINFNPPIYQGGCRASVYQNPGPHECTQPFTHLLTDLAAASLGTLPVVGNGYHIGLIDPTKNNSKDRYGAFFDAVFTGNLIITEAGDQTIWFETDDGFIFSVGPDQFGNQPTRVAGKWINITDEPSYFEGFRVMGGHDDDFPPTRASITINFPAPGIYPYELNYTQWNTDRMTLTMNDVQPYRPGAGGSDESALAPAGTLHLSSAAGAPQPVDTAVSVTVTAIDASNTPQAGLTVALSVRGANPNQAPLTVTTDANGQATFTYTGHNAGTDAVQATAWVTGIPLHSNVVPIEWTGSPSTAVPPRSEDPLASPGWFCAATGRVTVSAPWAVPLQEGVTLQAGVLEYWPADTPNKVHELATITGPVTGGADCRTALGTFDPTILPNGVYVVSLRGVDPAGVQQRSGVLVTVVGNYKPGRVRFTVTDLTIPLTGLPITVGRTYDSLERTELGDFGYGWSLAIGNPKLEVSPSHDVTLTLPNGERSTFYFTPRPSAGVFGFLQYPAYTPEAGVYGTLTANGCPLVVATGGGSGWLCFLANPAHYTPTVYTYTDPYGRVFTLDADGTLRQIRDLNGNTLTFAADGIRSSTGREVIFSRDRAVLSPRQVV